MKTLTVIALKESYRVTVNRVKQALFVKGYDAEAGNLSMTDTELDGVPAVIFETDSFNVTVMLAGGNPGKPDFLYDATVNMIYIDGKPVYMDNLDDLSMWMRDSFLP